MYRDAKTLALYAIVFVLSFIPILSFEIFRDNPTKYLFPQSSSRQALKAKGDFVWSSIKPNRHLIYTKCFGDLQCARLDVPLNWNPKNTSTHARAAIAIIKVPARVPVTDERYGGAILLNPGGPGNSGVHQVIRAGRHIQELVDASTPPSQTTGRDAKYFDIIGFDSRGVNNTTPRIKCFPNEHKRQEWDIQVAAEGLVGRSDADFNVAWARAKALGKTCSQETDIDGMGRYINSAQVVEDMVEIIERHGEWRQLEGKRLLTATEKEENYEETMDRLQWKRGMEKLQFWGISYGTILGATFSAMHPERVERVILDGVVDVADYYGLHWLRNLLDTDHIMTKFCEYCYEAGPHECPLYTGKSAYDVQIRVERIVDQLKQNPIEVSGSATYAPEVVGYSDIILKVVAALYTPTRSAEELFTLLAVIEKGNGTSVARLKQDRWKPVSITTQCERDGPFSQACLSSHYIRTDGPFPGIACMDAHGNGIPETTKQGFLEYIEALKGQSRWMGEYWPLIRLGCVGWTIRPEWTFDGPIQGNTARPILLVGNRFDPVTPLRNAHSVSSLFPGSVVLEYDMEGHSILTTPSLCTAKITRQYFQTGELPESGTVCLPHSRPFIGCLERDSNGGCRAVAENDKRTLQVLTEIIGLWP